MTPTIAQLYLAFRQAKAALFFEKRGVGLIELAAYERNLGANLEVLQKKLAGGKWFDELAIGDVWVVPKRLRSEPAATDDVIRIGAARPAAEARALDVQLRLTPYPDFAITEVLYLWSFGGSLDSLLSSDVVGYRLDLRQQKVVPHKRWLFEYWPKRYQEFRTAPLAAARVNLLLGNPTLVVSGDLANFYDTIDPSFMLQNVVAELESAGIQRALIDEYTRATSSLLRAISRFHKIASGRLGMEITVGVPIGALTSRVVANLVLAPLDRYVSTRPSVLCYRRYVDDLVIVAQAGPEHAGQREVVSQLLPLMDSRDGMLKLDVSALERNGSELQLQESKIKVHHLADIPGLDFVDAVTSDFSKALSERRAFVDSSTLVGDGVTHLIRAGNSEGSPLRVLREADRTRLERFALSTSLRSLERVSSLIDHGEARELVRRCLERVGRVLDAEDNWVHDLDVTFRLLKLAIITGDWKSASELLKRMDRVWGSVGNLRSRVPALYFRGQKVNSAKRSPWTWLRNYLHERRLEAISSCLPIGMDAKQVESKFPGGLRVRTREFKATSLRLRAEELAAADLRARDREDDAPQILRGKRANRKWMQEALSHDKKLMLRLSTIDDFVQRCVDLGGSPWVMPAARLFLCTRPPSYFDIARRLLYRVEEHGFDESVFEKLIEVVNAIRGTDYLDAVGNVVDGSTISIAAKAGDGGGASDPRIILGNLVVDDQCWSGSATRSPGEPFGRPVLNKKRLKGLATVLEKAEDATNGARFTYSTLRGSVRGVCPRSGVSSGITVPGSLIPP